MPIGIHSRVRKEGRAAEADAEGQTSFLSGRNDLSGRREDEDED
jgi:hypothetical protein